LPARDPSVPVAFLVLTAGAALCITMWKKTGVRRDECWQIRDSAVVAAAAVPRASLHRPTKHPLQQQGPRGSAAKNMMLRPFWGPNTVPGKKPPGITQVETMAKQPKRSLGIVPNIAREHTKLHRCPYGKGRACKQDSFDYRLSFPRGMFSASARPTTLIRSFAARGRRICRYYWHAVRLTRPCELHDRSHRPQPDCEDRVLPLGHGGFL